MENIGKILMDTINSSLCAIMVLYIGSKSYNKKVNLKKIENIFAIIIYIIFATINLYIEEKFLKVLLAYTMLMGLYKIIYDQDYNKSIFGSALVYMIVYITEIICGIGIMLLSSIFKINMFGYLENTILLTTIIVLITLGLYELIKPHIIKLINNSEHYKTQNSIFIYTILLIASTMVINKMYKVRWELNFELIANLSIFVVFLAIAFYITRQNLVNNRTKRKYSELSEYSKLTDRVLEEYRLKSHEFSNQLAIIKIMYEENNKELDEYLNTLIKKNKNHKYNWINSIKYIQLTGLKGLINYKIMEMNDEKIKLNINVSKECQNFNFENFSSEEKDYLYSIIGVYLDNAREASVKSDKKEITIEMYLENKNMIILIANTYKGNISKEKLGKYNYTTKGKSHGVGLYLVQNIVRNSNRYETETKIEDSLFIQKLIIYKTKKPRK